MLHIAQVYSCCFSAAESVKPLAPGGIAPALTIPTAADACDSAAAWVSKLTATGALWRSAAAFAESWHVTHLSKAETSSYAGVEPEQSGLVLGEFVVDTEDGDEPYELPLP